VPDPGVGLVKQLGHGQQIVEAQTVGFLPSVVHALLVAAAGNDAVPAALVAMVAPDRDLQDADADLVCGFRHNDLLLLELPAPPTGALRHAPEAAQPGASAPGPAKGRRLPRAESGLGSWTGPAADSQCRLKATGGAGSMGRRRWQG